MLASEGGEGAAPAEIASLMRAAGLPPEGRYLVAAMNAEADRMTGPNADRWRCDLAEELAVPPAEGTAEGTVVAPLGDQIVTLVPLPPGSGPGALEGSDSPRGPASRRRPGRARLRGPAA